MPPRGKRPQAQARAQKLPGACERSSNNTRERELLPEQLLGDVFDCLPSQPLSEIA